MKGVSAAVYIAFFSVTVNYKCTAWVERKQIVTRKQLSSILIIVDIYFRVVKYFPSFHVRNQT